jgi:hypothetical protein
MKIQERLSVPAAPRRGEAPSSRQISAFRLFLPHRAGLKASSSRDRIHDEE